MKKIASLFVLLLLMILVPTSSAHAAPTLDRVIESGETVHEDLVIWGGTLHVEEGAEVDGDVSVFGGTAILNGQIDGDVVIFGGTASLAGTVDGDLVLFGGTLASASSAAVDGDCLLIGGTLADDGATNINCSAVGDFPAIAIPEFNSARAPEAPEAPRVPRVSGGRSFFGTISGAAAQSLVFALLAVAAAAVLPNHLSQVSATLKEKPAASGAVGFLTLIASVSAIVLLAILSAILMLVCVGFLGIPIVIALSVALGAALLLGWVAAGTWLGARMADWLKLQNRSLIVTTALGTATLTLVAALFSALPFLLGGWLWSVLAFVVACAGLGAVALTRFGTRPYPVDSGADSDKVAAMVEMLPDDDEEMPEKPAGG